MRVMVTGANGYIGNALLHALSTTKHEVLGLDTYWRKVWVKECGGESLTHYEEKPFLFCNVADLNGLANALAYFKPDVIIHLASQPSGPYSEIDIKHRVDTQTNNLTMLMNLLHLPQVLNFKPKYIVTTTTGVPGAPGEPIVESHMANLAGSSYHASRGFDSANINLACRQLGLNILEMRTAIVYGTRIDGVDEAVTRFDWDFYFGTAIHRFLLNRLTNKDITIYGKGEQMKPVISLRDTVRSILNAIEEPTLGHQIVNQTTQCLSVLDMAQAVGGNVTHIPNPRVEKEEYKMDIRNDKFLKLLNATPSTINSEIMQMKSDLDLNLLPKEYLKAYDGIFRQQA